MRLRTKKLIGSSADEEADEEEDREAKVYALPARSHEASSEDQDRGEERAQAPESGLIEQPVDQHRESDQHPSGCIRGHGGRQRASWASNERGSSRVRTRG